MSSAVLSIPKYSAKIKWARRRKKIRRVARYVGIIGVCVVALFPVYWMVVGSFQPEDDTLSYPPSLFFKGFTFSAITSLFKDQPLASWIVHSFEVSAVTVVMMSAPSTACRLPALRPLRSARTPSSAPRHERPAQSCARWPCASDPPRRYPPGKSARFCLSRRKSPPES